MTIIQMLARDLCVSERTITIAIDRLLMQYWVNNAKRWNTVSPYITGKKVC